MTVNWSQRWNILGIAVFSVALSACGGGGSGGGGSSSNDDPDSATTQSNTFSGNVELVNGTAEAHTRPWEERLLAFFMADTRAAIGGLIDAPDGTTVRLIRIGNDGNEVDQLATTQTDNGRFTFEVELDSEAGGDLIIEAGSASDPVRAPAGGEDVVVNPVSSSIVNKVIERVQAGGAFSDFRASDLASLVRIVIDELDTANVTFSGSNAAAATQADDDAGDVDDDLVASVEGENSVATAFVGDKNLAAIDVLLEAFGDNAGFAVLNNTLAPAITDDLRLDASGVTTEDARTERGWSFDGSGNVTSTGTQDTTTETGADGEGFDVTVGADGRLFALGGNIRGAVSDDGELFAMTQTSTELDGNGAAFGLFAGASTWNPGDVTETFNFVKFDGYVDKNSTDDQVGFTTTLTGEVAMNCAAGSCDLDLDRFTKGADFRKYFAQIGPDTANPFSTGESSNDGVLALNGIGLGTNGSLSGTAEGIVGGSASGVDFRTRGFVAPDAGMLLLQLSGEDQTFFEDFIVGLPKGSSCDQSNLDGAYNMVWLTGVLNETGPTVAIESETLVAKADGAGNLDISASRYREAVLSFNGTNTGLSRDVIADTDETGIPYSVATDCKLTISDTAGDRVLGAVSPDGRAFLLATYTVESGGAETFQSLGIGLRRPAP